MILDFFILADGANFSEGKLNIHGGAITRLNAPIFPFPVPRLVAVARFLVEPADDDRVEVTLVWRDDADHELAPMVRGELDPRPDHWGAIPVEGEDRSAVVVAEMSGLPLERPGRVVLELGVNGEVVARRNLIVVDVRQLEPGAAM